MHRAKGLVHACPTPEASIQLCRPSRPRAFS
jgi:hypothetical protein